MFSLKVIDTDNFLDMSVSARELYFQFGMRADDDGFVSNPKRIMKMVGASDDDLRMLVAKQFIIPMATNGVCVVTHWKINNFIRPDRYEATQFKEEKLRLNTIDGKYSFDFMNKIGIPDDIPDDIPRLGKDRLGKVSIEKEANSRFAPPSLEDVKNYCEERNNGIDPEAFIAFYESKDWMIGKNKMKKWQAAIITWEKRPNSNSKRKIMSI